MTINKHAATRRITRIARPIGTVGIGLCVALASAVCASAEEKQTEAEIKAGCKEANGRYETSSGPKGRLSTCSYKTIDGTTWIDVYVDGTYTNTLNEAKSEIPTPPPVLNPGLAPPRFG
jgi:hypothetical protein